MKTYIRSSLSTLAACVLGFLISCQAGPEKTTDRHHLRLESTELAAYFQSDGTLEKILDKTTGQYLLMESPEEFRIVSDKVSIGPDDCRRSDIHQQDGRLEITCRYSSFDIRVIYTLGKEDHFLEKKLVIHHLGRESFDISHISMGRWKQEENSGQLVPFQHGQCLTYFLRRPEAGFFFGVETPFQDAPQLDSAVVSLSYPVSIIFPAGSTYEAETAYWGVYRPTGQYAPSVPTLLKESVLSHIQPDRGESDAMLRMVRRLASPRGGITVCYNGYQGGLYYGDYSAPDGMMQAEQDIKTIRLAKKMLGPCYIQPAGPFFGAYLGATTLTPEDENLPIPAARTSVVNWINTHGLQTMNWACLKAVHGWHHPRLGPYCRQYPQWQADSLANCMANPEFVELLTRIIVNDCKAGGFTGLLSDEPLPGPRYYQACEKAGHAHLPGNVSYAYFYQRRKMFRTLREEFGPDFELQGQRPHQDAGIWDGIYLNSLFTFLEYAGVKGETLRLYSRMRRSYSFVPSYMDQILIQPGLEAVDITMLSALAVSSNYLFIAPSRPQDLKAHRNALMNDNKLISQAFQAFPESERQRVRYWMDWARDHSEFMDHVIDLPDWPGKGKPDGYLRLLDGRGFAFLFNSTDSAQYIAIPLNETVGLDKASYYRIDPVHAPGAGSVTGRGEAKLLLPPHAAWLMEIGSL